MSSAVPLNQMTNFVKMNTQQQQSGKSVVNEYDLKKKKLESEINFLEK